MKRRRKTLRAKRAPGPFRSGLEAKVVPPLIDRGARYEPVSLNYPAGTRRYIPDVVFANGIALEIKGYFTPADRTKMLAVKAAYPTLDLRLVLQAPGNRLSPKSKTTYAQWCDAKGFRWCESGDTLTLDRWIRLPYDAASMLVLDTMATPIVRKKRVQQTEMPL